MTQRALLIRGIMIGYVFGTTFFWTAEHHYVNAIAHLGVSAFFFVTTMLRLRESEKES